MIPLDGYHRSLALPLVASFLNEATPQSLPTKRPLSTADANQWFFSVGDTRALNCCCHGCPHCTVASVWLHLCANTRPRRESTKNSCNSTIVSTSTQTPAESHPPRGSCLYQSSNCTPLQYKFRGRERERERERERVRERERTRVDKQYDCRY